jgi:hypothetical protein
MALIAAAVYGATLFGIGMWFIRKHRLEAEREESRRTEDVLVASGSIAAKSL